jgi:2-oxoisovalerate dehydrogenase E1 component
MSVSIQRPARTPLKWRGKSDDSSVEDPELRNRLVGKMARIRVFEKKLLQMFADGRLFGTTHTCIGQEAGTVALYEHLDSARDAVFANHRCHGQFLAWGGTMRELMAEIMGRKGGVCGGRGGSQHLCKGRFFSQGIQAGSLPIAVGYAWQIRRLGKEGIVVAHIGDGTLGEGLVYESINFASLLKVPLLLVVEHNGVAQSTNTRDVIAGDIASRFAAFDVPVDRREAHDPVELSKHFESVVDIVRKGQPYVQILDTFRLMAHSKGDDDRPHELVEAAWQQDYLQQRISAGDSIAVNATATATSEVDSLADELEDTEFAPLDGVDVYAQPTAPICSSPAEFAMNPADHCGSRIGELLNAALASSMNQHSNLLVIGEDIADPYGGAFKVTRNLSTEFPDRVFSTPIAEAALVGVANGVALAGGRSVAEIMFGDFVTLAVDQIVNQAAKAHFVYGGQVSVPTTVRLPSGGYRGYGPTHSQSLERMFCGVPGLNVVALSRRHHPTRLLNAAVNKDPNPVIFVENKSLYSMKPQAGAPDGFESIPQPIYPTGEYPNLVFSTNPGAAADMTVVTYGGLTDMVETAMEQLILDQECEFDYIVLTQLYPLNTAAIVDSCRETGRLLVIEEATDAYGIGSEVLAAAVQQSTTALKASKLGARPMPIPNSRRQEDLVLPNATRILNAITDLL